MTKKHKCNEDGQIVKQQREVKPGVWVTDFKFHCDICGVVTLAFQQSGRH